MEGGGEVSDTPQTDKRKEKGIEWVPINIMALFERENTALRAHAERLAEALEDARNAMKTCRCHCYSDGMVHHQSFDTKLIANSESLSHQALTLYRAENPKV